MELAEWIEQLEPVEQGYARQSFRFWNGSNGDKPPEIPEGMSRARADVLRYHTKALNNNQIGKRKIGESRPVSFRWASRFKKELAFEAAKLDCSLNEYVLRCLNAGRPMVMAYPKLSKIFEDPCLQK